MLGGDSSSLPGQLETFGVAEDYDPERPVLPLVAAIRSSHTDFQTVSAQTPRHTQENPDGVIRYFLILPFKETEYHPFGVSAHRTRLNTTS